MNQDRTKRQLEISAAITREVIDAVAKHIPADATIAAIFKKKSSFGARDRRMYAHVVFSWFRWRGWVESIAPGDLPRQCALAVAMDPSTEAGLREAWSSIAAIDTSTLNLPSDQLMPAWLPEILPDEQVRHDFIHACAKRPPTWLVVDPAEVAMFSMLLGRQKIAHHVDARIRGAFSVTSRFHLASIEKIWGKAIQVQDIASQTVAIIAGAKSGEHWWDACAGAGGKTLAMARAVGTSGHVLASDLRSSVLNNLRERAAGHQIQHITTRELNAELQRPGPVFDGVLVDAPCSGLGTWPRNPDARWRLNRSDIDNHAARQLRMLRHASAAVKSGGTLVYAVCSIAPAEGPDVIHQFCAHHPDFTLAAFAHPLRGERIRGMTTVYPWEGPGDGMFIARLQRTGGNRS